jgi:hypothetical protein
MARDRVNICKGRREYLDKLKDDNVLGLNLIEAKDIFMFAVALGLDDPVELNSKDGYYLMKNLESSDKAELAAVLLGTALSDDEVDKYADIDKCIDLCEECAESGFRRLQKHVEDVNSDWDLLERRMLNSMKLAYLKNVKATML